MGDSPLVLGRAQKTPVRRRRDSEAMVPEQAPDCIPRASPAALHFLQSLDSNDYKKVEFNDRLTTFSDNGKEIGTFSISVASSSSNGFSDSFLVRASSVGKVDGMLCGTKLTSHISRSMLETIEHHQHDFLILKDENLKRDTVIIKQANGFLVSQTTSRGQDVKKTSRFVENRYAAGLITEAADLILQRLLVLKGLPDDFLLISFDMNCNIGPAKYERLKEKMESSPGTSAELVGICRTVASWRDKPLTWHSQFATSGQLTFRHQIGSTVSMRLVPNNRTENVEEVSSTLWNCIESDKTKSKFITSSYTNGKTKSTVDSKTYLRQHPELNTITTDFLQLLLIQKPTNVHLFAANYFSALASETDASETTAVGTT